MSTSVRVFYLMLDLLKFYTIFDKCSQIVGLEILQAHEYKDKLTRNLEILRTEHGQYETFLYTEMINDKYQIYEYELQKLDLKQLQIITDATIIDDTEKTLIPISNKDIQDCDWFSLRDDIISSFIEFINDRIFEHEIVKCIKQFDPKIWKRKYVSMGEDRFVREYLNTTIDEMVVFWPRINARTAKIGLRTVKKLFINHYLDENVTLSVFAVAIIKDYRYDQTMLCVRILYASMIAILPSGMVLENWNSISTCVWSSLRKLLSCESIDEFVNAKINGPSIANYDARVVASKEAEISRKVAIDTNKHMEQKYLRSFFGEMQKSYNKLSEDIQKLENIRPSAKKRINIKEMAHKSNAVIVFGKNSNIHKRQTNLSEYFRKDVITNGQIVFKNIFIMSNVCNYIDFDSLAQSISSVCRNCYSGYKLFIYSDLNICRLYEVGIGPLGEAEHNYYNLIVNNAHDWLHRNGLRKYERDTLQYKDLRVWHFVELFDIWYAEDALLSKGKIISNLRIKYNLHSYLKKDIKNGHFKEALKQFRAKVNQK